MASQKDELYAVLMALGGDTLLLPNIAIAEVLGFDRLRPEDGGPAWLAGRCEYNSRLLPVVSFEALNGGEKPLAGRRTRIAVVNCVGNKLSSGQYAVLCQGYPHLVTLNRTALVSEPLADTDRTDLVVTRVKIANTAAAIPNLETVEADIAQL